MTSALGRRMDKKYTERRAYMDYDVCDDVYVQSVSSSLVER